MTHPGSQERVVVVGAGPAGLAAAWALARQGRLVTVCDASPEVGGLARSFDRWGWRLDVGSHIFDGSRPAVDALWREVIGDRFHHVELRRGIQRNRRCHRYPLGPAAVVSAAPLAALGALRRSRREPASPDVSARDVIAGRYGDGLYRAFFEGYLWKLWGLPGEEVDAAFARDLIGDGRSSGWRSRTGAAVRPAPSSAARARTFPYPADGIGAICDGLMRSISAHGGEVRTSSPVGTIVTDDGGRVRAVEAGGETVECGQVVSSMPLRRLVAALGEPASPAVDAASRMRARSTVLVYLRVIGGRTFPELWRYVFDHGVLTGRVANVGAWWPEGSARPARAGETVLCAELWCDPSEAGNPVWGRPDHELTALVADELEATGAVTGVTVADSHVRRLAATHPVPVLGFRQDLAEISRVVDGIGGLTTIGRHGQHGQQDVAGSLESGLMAAAAAATAEAPAAAPAT